MPFFSIIIPTYNRANFIAKTLDSLLKQTFHDFEIIVVDDGSTDNTEDVVNSFNHSKIFYHRKQNAERGAARNYGAKLAKGQFLNFFDSDDLAYPNHLYEAIKVVETKGHPPVFHLGYDLQNPSGEIIRAENIPDGDVSSKLIFTNFLSCNGVFIRKDIFDKFLFPEDRRMAASEDWALWLTLASRYPLMNKNVITSSVVMHDQRSIHDWNADKVIVRDTLLIDYLINDNFFVKKYKHQLRRFISDRYTFFMLLLAVSKRKRETLDYAYKAIKKAPSVIFRKRFVASILKLIKK